MPRVTPDGAGHCQVCQHDSRLAIEQAIVAGKSHLSICRNFGIGSRVGTPEFRPDHKKIARHLAHMGEAYARAREAGEIEAGSALGERLDYLDDATTEVIERLRQGEIVTHDGQPVLLPDGSYKRRYRDVALLQAVNEARHNLELRHKLAGSLADGPGDAVDQVRKALESPEAARLLAALDDHLAAPQPVQENQA